MRHGQREKRQVSTHNRYVFPDRSAATRLIIATDGEGKNLPFTGPHPDAAVSRNGWHSYTLLAASDDAGRHKALDGPLAGREPDGAAARNLGLSTAACLDFLLSLPHDALVSSFYFSYDVVKIAADLPLDNLRELASGKRPGSEDHPTIKTPDAYRARITEIARKFNLPVETVKSAGTAGIVAPESTVWGNYWIQYMPRKKLTITDLSAGRYWIDQFGKRTPKWHRQVIVWDVFGFFQKSFVKALQDAPGICPPEVIARISAMKDQRGDFANLPDSKIREYCYEECYYLARLVRDMLIHIENLGLKLNGYDGTGAIARAWMTREKIKDYKSDTNLPFDIALRAYFGGRFEVSELGYIGKCYSYDINSAYPAIAAKLPCLAHGRFRQLQPDANGHVDYVPGATGVYLAGSETTGRYAPFPFRIDDARALSTGNVASKAVYYAHGGKRWIWQDEIAIARKHFGADAIPLYDAWVWEPQCDHKPFNTIPDLYAQRAVYKADGPGSDGYNGIEKVIKLLINSIYGKTAQSVGWTLQRDGTLKPPAFQSFIWAGLITSGTRAMILDAIMQSDTVSIATDGILTRTPLDNVLPISKRLGDWDSETVTETYLFQSGVYAMLNSKGQRVYKTRGFAGKEIPAEKLISAWETHNLDMFTVEPEPDATRFVPIKAGVMRTDALDYIGQWVQSKHKVTIAHNRRTPDYELDEYGQADEIIGLTLGSEPVTFAADDMSAPYTLKETWQDIEDERQHIEGDYYEMEAIT